MPSDSTSLIKPKTSYLVSPNFCMIALSFALRLIIFIKPSLFLEGSTVLDWSFNALNDGAFTSKRSYRLRQLSPAACSLNSLFNDG